MKLEILHVPDCPNVALLDQRIEEALAGHPGPVDLARRVIEDQQAAVAAGMIGSPTLLVDGVDPFGEPGAVPSLSCRLYRGLDGRVQGAPSVVALRGAMGLAELDPNNDCCVGENGASATAALRDRRARTAPTDPAERALHRTILRAFAATGAPPDHGVLDEVAAGFAATARDVLARLHTADVVRLGSDGRIRVAYPFSASPTRHRVRFPDGTEVFAMCAIDALGVPPMLGRDAVISTADPVDGAPITVTVADDRFAWTPDTAVVFVGAQPGDGPSAETCCDHLNMFTDQRHADTWIQAHPHVLGEILTPAPAERLGRSIFGALLADE